MALLVARGRRARRGAAAGYRRVWTWEDDYRRSFANAAAHVEDLLDGAAENYSPGIEAARSLEIIVGFYLSHYTGATVDVPLAEPLREIPISSW